MQNTVDIHAIIHVNSYLKGKKAAAQDDTLKEFAEHFKICQTAELPSKMLIKMIELDKPITLSEICYAIIRLKREGGGGLGLHSYTSYIYYIDYEIDIESV